MSEHRYTLEPYNGPATRYHCPACGKRAQFTRYIDRATGDHIHPSVGKCNREQKCGYHKPPRNHFEETGTSPANTEWKPEYRPPQPTTLIPISYVHLSMNGRAPNYFMDYLVSLFGTQRAELLQQRFYIGASKHWPGATVFWQVDLAHQVRTGKVMVYNTTTGKRVKDPPRIHWAHSLIQKQYGIEFVLEQCLFGLHQLATTSNQTVALVESEKTAVISSVYFPQFLWMATGGLQNLSATKLKPLVGRKVFAFPDLGAEESWQEKVTGIREVLAIDIEVQGFLREFATAQEICEGLDLEDYIVERDPVTGYALNAQGKPLYTP